MYDGRSSHLATPPPLRVHFSLSMSSLSLSVWIRLQNELTFYYLTSHLKPKRKMCMHNFLILKNFMAATS